MLIILSSLRIFLARTAMDTRLEIKGLVSLVKSSPGENPRSGDYFVFMGRDRRRLKVQGLIKGPTYFTTAPTFPPPIADLPPGTIAGEPLVPRCHCRSLILPGPW